MNTTANPAIDAAGVDLAANPAPSLQHKIEGRALRSLRSRVGRVQRDVQRQLGVLPEQARKALEELLQRTGRILAQRPAGTGYALADMDLARQAQVRSEFPALEHRVLDRH